MEESNEKIKLIYARLCDAQKNFKQVKFDSSAQITATRSYKYASLSAVLEATVPALNAEGLSFVQETSISYEKTESGSIYPLVSVSTMIFSVNGESLNLGTLSMPCRDNNPHSIGSILTYARRYSAISSLGVAAMEDDDANIVQNQKIEPKQSQQQTNGGSNAKVK